jgi:hypothetical protein
MLENITVVIFKIFFIWKYIKIIYFFIFKKLFLILAHQNDLKISKNINLKQRKNIIFFQKRFWTVKINRTI